MDEELRFHLDRQVEKLVHEGHTPMEAERRARIYLGGLDQAREEYRDSLGLRWLDDLSRDLRFAFRALRRDRAFTLVATIVIAMAMAVGTSVFSVVDAVVLRGLPFYQDERLIAVLEHDPSGPLQSNSGWTTIQTFLAWRERQESLEAIAAAGFQQRLRIRGERGEAIEVPGLRISHELLDVLRVSPVAGRPLTAADEENGGRRVVLISHGFWVRRYGAHPNAIGAELEINDHPHKVIGVLPQNVTWPVGVAEESQLYLPLPITESSHRFSGGRNHNWLVVGRLRPGASLRQSRDEFSSVTAALAAAFPEWFRSRVALVTPLREHIHRDVRSWMLLLLGAGLVVILIATANVANLMLARATVRVRELGVRAALGANRRRLIQQVVIEGVVLATGSAVIGVAVTIGSLAAIVAWLPAGVPRAASIAVDGRVLIVAAMLAIAIGVVFSLGPALVWVRSAVGETLRAGGRTMTATGGRLRAALVLTEVAFAAFLVIGAALFITSVARWRGVELGFDHRNLVTLNVGLPLNLRLLEETAARRPDEVTAYVRGHAGRNAAAVREVMEAVAHVPGVERVGASAVSGVPLSGSYSLEPITLPGRADLSDAGEHIYYRRVTAGYLEALRVPLHRGRLLTDMDVASRAQVMVINESAARLYWPDRSPIGQKLTVGTTNYEVVGVVGDTRHRGPEFETGREAYVPMTNWVGIRLLVRTSRDPAMVLPSIRSAISTVSRDLIVSGDVVTLEGLLDRLVAQRRFVMAMLALLAGSGLLIAAVGVYGVMAYAVSQRRQEIGVRMALGARAADIAWMVIGRAVILVTAGLGVGIGAVWIAAAVVQTFLFQVSATDPRIIGVACTVLVLAALAASAVPARRAATVDPASTLRCD
jgi:predicted permease